MNKTNPLISIIMPTYNRVQMLEEAMQSVIQQSYSNWELLIVDDNSTDGTQQLLDQYVAQDKRICYYRLDTSDEQRKNRYTGAVARNFALQQIKGDYITYLDDDNKYESNRFEILLQYFKENPTVDFVYHDQHLLIFDEEHQRWITKYTFTNVVEYTDHIGMEFTKETLKQRNYIDTSTVMYKSYLQYWRWIEDKLSVDDWELWLRMQKYVDMVYVNKILGQYRVHHESKISWTYFKWIKDYEYRESGTELINRIDTKLKKHATRNSINPRSVKVENCNIDKSMSVDIILVNWNTLRFLKNCIKSIEKNTLVPYNIVIIDNGSTDGSQDYISSLSYKHILNKDNKGYGGAANQAYNNLCTSDWICLLNVDTEVPKGWIALMIEIFQKHDKCGAVGPVQNKLQCVYSDNFDTRDTIQQTSAPSDEELLVEYLMGFCLLIHRDVLKDIGFFDERFVMGTYDDTDFSRRLVANEYQLYVCKRVMLYHYYNSSFELNRVDYPAILEMNRQKYIAKWNEETI